MFKSKIPKKLFNKNSKESKKEELDLDDKEKVEVINFKKQEVRLKSEEADLKKLNVLEKTFELDVWEKDRKSNNDFSNMMKVITLKGMLESCQVNEDTSYGSEMKLKNTFDTTEVATLKNKLFNLIDKM